MPRACCNLIAQHLGVMAGITYIHVSTVAKPWHVDSEQRWHGRWHGRGLRRQSMINGG